MLLPILFTAALGLIVYRTRATTREGVSSRGWEVKRNTFGTRGPRAQANGRELPNPATNVRAFLTTFPGNPAEIVLVSDAGDEGVAIANGQYATTPGGQVVAEIAYDPAAKAKGSWTDYPQLPWMPPAGTLVELAAEDVDYVRGPNGERSFNERIGTPNPMRRVA